MTASYEISESVLRQNGLEALAFTCLRQIINRHPVMSVSIVDEGSANPSWVRLPEIDLKKVVHFKSLAEQETTSSEGIIEAAHRMPFEQLGELPLWRVVLIQHPTTSSKEETTAITKTIDVGFFWHHGIGDGASGVAFHQEFLDALNDLAVENHVPSAETIAIPSKLDLLPSIEEAHPLPLSAFFLIRQLFKSILPCNSDRLLWTGPPIRSENNITHLRTLVFPSPIVDALLRVCRENGVTLTSLLIVVIARALATTYSDYQRFKCKTAISFRRFIGTEKRAMVNYVTSISHWFSSIPKTGYNDCGGDFSWNAVRACKREINTATAGAKNHTIGLLKYLDDYAGWLRTRVGLQRVDSFEVSNVGVMDGGLDDQSKVAKVKRILFSQSSNVIGPPYVFSVATAKEGDLAIVLTWQDGILTVESAEKVLAGLEAELQGLANCQ
jgi:Alcohol acetyltransferase